MASFGPQVKNMAQVEAGGKGEKAFAGGVHRSECSLFPVSLVQSPATRAQSLPHPWVR